MIKPQSVSRNKSNRVDWPKGSTIVWMADLYENPIGFNDSREIPKWSILFHEIKKKC